MSAGAAAAAIRAGTLSSSAILADLLSRIDAIDPIVKAWVTIDREGAESAARELDDEAERGHFRGLLHGVPIGVKDIYHVAGMRTTAGAGNFAHQLAETDAVCVRRLREAGAVLLGKTSTTEFAYLDPCDTRNPWDTSHTPGGSSSGSAAAVAARMVPAALGSQTGGSTLRPAAYCGVVGFKPTYGRISCKGMATLSWSLDHVGLVCRTVEDAALLLQVMAGPEPADALTSHQPVEDYLRALNQPPSLRFGIVRGPFDARVDSEILDHAMRIASDLRRAGASVTEVALPPSLNDCDEAHRRIEQVEAAAVHAARFAIHADRYRPMIRKLIESGLGRSGIDYAIAALQQLQAKRDILGMFDGVTALITPVGAPAQRMGDPDRHPNFWRLWSFVGLPALSLPTGLSREGLPMATQLICAPFAEAALLAVARWCESVLGFSDRPRISLR